MKRLDFYKENKIDIEIPKGFMNVGIAHKKGEFPVLIADTNDSANWDTIRIPLPNGNWEISKYHDDGKTITLVHHKVKRTFFSPWF